MKKLLLFLFLGVFLIGCAPLNVIYSVKNLFSIDFTPFTEKNFLITPEKYVGTYESIGLITYERTPGANYQLIKRVPNPNYIPNHSAKEERYFETYKWKVDSISFSDVLNEVYDICVKMGADAIINFKTEHFYTPYTNIKNPITITGYTISGFAIKRKNSE